MRLFFSLLFGLLLMTGCKQDKNDTIRDNYLNAPSVTVPPVIDGALDPTWSGSPWHPIENVWAGETPASEDFSGRFKVCWTPQKLYVLAEITDNRAVDLFMGLDKFSDDDCLEIFLDADHSGGSHEFSHNAFDYHIALNDFSVIDYGTNKKPQFFNNHIQTARRFFGTTHTWEMAISVYDKNFKEGKTNQPITLQGGQKLGFAIAYNDSDGEMKRENWIGSIPIDAEDKTIIKRNADYFATLDLVAL